MTGITKPNEVSHYTIQDVEQFTLILNTMPEEQEIQTNNGVSYLPISILELKLDYFFAGLWQTRNFSYSLIGNEITGSIDLGVFHPISREWIWRNGTGSVMISGMNPGKDDPKKKNALVKDLPHLKGECFKNAAKGLGRAFGRDLNRSILNDYTPLGTHIAQLEDAKHQLALCSSIEDMKELLGMFPLWGANKMVMDAFTTRKKEIQQANKT